MEESVHQGGPQPTQLLGAAHLGAAHLRPLGNYSLHRGSYTGLGTEQADLPRSVRVAGVPNLPTGQQMPARSRPRS